MALESCSLVLRCHGASCRPTVRLPIACSRRFLPVSCKMRNRNFRRQQTKKVPKEVSPFNMNYQPLGDENREGASSDDVLSTHREALSSADADINLVKVADTAQIREEEKFTMIHNADDDQQLSSVRLEYLIEMIRNAEKNILLLNQARVRALNDLDKILSEKEDLQAEMNMLQKKLAETNEKIKVAAREQVNVEHLENQIEKLKNKISSMNTTDGGRHDSQGAYGISLDANGSPLVEELNTLREENALLKDHIQSLKTKVTDAKQTEERVIMLEEERSSLESAIRQLESKLAVSPQDVSELVTMKSECKDLKEKVENLQTLHDDATKQAEKAVIALQLNQQLQKKVDKLEILLEEANATKLSDNFLHSNESLKQKIKILEERLHMSDQEINSYVKLYQDSVKEFQDSLNKLSEETKRNSLAEPADDMPSEFWSRLLLTIDGWFLEKKISSNDAESLRDMAWKRETQIRDAYLASKGKNEDEALAAFLKLTLSATSPGLHIIHIAAEMAPVAKVGGLGDVVSGLGKALQRKGHLVEIILPKYDCMQLDRVSDMKVLDVMVPSYFDGKVFNNKVWVGTVEGLPVYFIEPQHPANFFWRGQFYGENDDFKRFSFFSRAALELLYQAGKKPDIIHCHDWQTAFVAPLYWEIYATKGFNSAKICFTCHNFEYQGTAHASELASCGLDVHHLNRPDRMQDNSSQDRVNPVKGGIVFSNIVTTVSPTYAQEVCTSQGGQGLHDTLNFHSRKFVGVLNGIDTEAWNPSTDDYLRVQYNADDLQGKTENKIFIRKLLKLSSADTLQPLVGCITRLVPQKGVHLIRHAIYRTLDLGGQFVLLGSSPVPHIQKEFEGIAKVFEGHPHVRLLLKYDDALSHTIYAATDMFIIPSIFEPCGLTQMIAMRYGSVPIVRKTGGLNDSVFDVDDDTVPVQYRNGFSFVSPDEQALSSVMERAFNYYTKTPEIWQQLVQKVMRMDFSWELSAAQYEELYSKSVARARAVNRANAH